MFGRYDRCREAEAERLRVLVSALDKAVTAAHRTDAEPTVNVVEIVPWSDRFDPATLLRELSETISRFIVCRTETAHAVRLVGDDFTPRKFRCGARRPWPASATSPTP
jgi:putative DNA primase/helicase